MYTHIEDYSPYRALWAAVLVQAVRDMDDYDKSVARSASDWVFSEDTSPTSFNWICSMLDIPAEEMQMKCITKRGRWEIVGPQYEQYMKNREQRERG